jgi:hypothetical protein
VQKDTYRTAAWGSSGFLSVLLTVPEAGKPELYTRLKVLGRVYFQFS